MLIQERIQMILKMHNLTSAAFADKIGVQRSSVSHVISGRNKPGLDFLEKILLHFPRVNAQWLITGKASSEDKQVVEKEEVNIKSKLQESIRDKGKKIDRIVIFYSDGSFSNHTNAE